MSRTVMQYYMFSLYGARRVHELSILEFASTPNSIAPAALLKSWEVKGVHNKYHFPTGKQKKILLVVKIQLLVL